MNYDDNFYSTESNENIENNLNLCWINETNHFLSQITETTQYKQNLNNCSFIHEPNQPIKQEEEECFNDLDFFYLSNQLQTSNDLIQHLNASNNIDYDIPNSFLNISTKTQLSNSNYYNFNQNLSDQSQKNFDQIHDESNNYNDKNEVEEEILKYIENHQQSCESLNTNAHNDESFSNLTHYQNLSYDFNYVPRSQTAFVQNNLEEQRFNTFQQLEMNLKNTCKLKQAYSNKKNKQQKNYITQKYLKHKDKNENYVKNSDIKKPYKKKLKKNELVPILPKTTHKPIANQACNLINPYASSASLYFSVMQSNTSLNGNNQSDSNISLSLNLENFAAYNHFNLWKNFTIIPNPSM